MYFHFLLLGPDFWGLLNPEWNLCSKGHRQSPVDVDPNKLLYDPFLRVIHVDKHRVSSNSHLILLLRTY